MDLVQNFVKSFENFLPKKKMKALRSRIRNVFPSMDVCGVVVQALG